MPKPRKRQLTPPRERAKSPPPPPPRPEGPEFGTVPWWFNELVTRYQTYELTQAQVAAAINVTEPMLEWARYNGDPSYPEFAKHGKRVTYPAMNVAELLADKKRLRRITDKRPRPPQLQRGLDAAKARRKQREEQQPEPQPAA